MERNSGWSELAGFQDTHALSRSFPYNTRPWAMDNYRKIDTPIHPSSSEPAVVSFCVKKVL